MPFINTICVKVSRGQGIAVLKKTDSKWIICLFASFHSIAFKPLKAQRACETEWSGKDFSRNQCYEQIIESGTVKQTGSQNMRKLNKREGHTQYQDKICYYWKKIFYHVCIWYWPKTGHINISLHLRYAIYNKMKSNHQ